MPPAYRAAAGTRNRSELSGRAELGAPHFNLHQEDMHFACIEVGGVAWLPGRGFLTGDEVGVGHLFTAEIGFLEVALNPLRSRVGTSGANQYSLISVYHMWLSAFCDRLRFAPWA